MSSMVGTALSLSVFEVLAQMLYHSKIQVSKHIYYPFVMFAGFLFCAMPSALLVADHVTQCHVGRSAGGGGITINICSGGLVRIYLHYKTIIINTGDGCEIVIHPESGRCACHK